jgi:hypothetical protein
MEPAAAVSLSFIPPNSAAGAWLLENILGSFAGKQGQQAP